LEDQTLYRPVIEIAVVKIYRDAAKLPTDDPAVLGVASGCAIEMESAR
jgi:hypothetical protein